MCGYVGEKMGLVGIVGGSKEEMLGELGDMKLRRILERNRGVVCEEEMGKRVNMI